MEDEANVNDGFVLMKEAVIGFFCTEKLLLGFRNRESIRSLHPLIVNCLVLPRDVDVQWAAQK